MLTVMLMFPSAKKTRLYFKSSKKFRLVFRNKIAKPITFYSGIWFGIIDFKSE